MLQAEGDEVIGLDLGYFEACTFGPEPASIDIIRKDVRELTADDIPQVDAVIHLAALSNDALGHLSPEITHEVNTLSTLRVAELARDAGVEGDLPDQPDLFSVQQEDDAEGLEHIPPFVAPVAAAPSAVRVS